MGRKYFKGWAAFSGNRGAWLEIVVATLVTAVLVGVFYSQARRAGAAKERVFHSHEVRHQIQVVYGALRGAVDSGMPNAGIAPARGDSAMGWGVGGLDIGIELRKLRELVADDPAQSRRADSLSRFALTARREGKGAELWSLVRSMLDAEYLEFKVQEGIEKKFWERNRVLLRGGVLVLYFGLLVAVRVSERRKRRRLELESSLRENDILLQSVMDGGKHAIIVADRNGSITFFNRAAERMLGYKAAEFAGRPVSELLESLQVPQAMDNGEHEWTAIRRDGSPLAVSLSMTVMRGGEGSTHGYLAVLHDISERKEIERVKNGFISTVSHELRTPLTAVHAALGLLQAAALDPAQASELGATAHKNSERLVRIANDILDVEKIEAGKLSLNPGTVEVDRFMREALEANAAYGEKYGVRFVNKAACGGDARMLADPDRLMQVFANLLSNAAKYSPAGSEVWIGAECRGGRVHFSVRDFGEGIPEEFHGRVFEKFAQANFSNDRRFEGSGLGLSISKLLVEAMGGSIGFDTRPGKGTMFHFDLPEAAVPA